MISPFALDEVIALAVIAKLSKKKNPDPAKAGSGADAFRNPRTPGRSSCAPAELYPPTRIKRIIEQTEKQNLKTKC